VISGDPRQLKALLAQPRSFWSVEATATNNDVGFARLKADLNVPYREIGSLIFQAQQRQLEATSYTDPRICGMDDR
jgi:hypothetical protein